MATGWVGSIFFLAIFRFVLGRCNFKKWLNVVMHSFLFFHFSRTILEQFIFPTLGAHGLDTQIKVFCKIIFVKKVNL